MTQVAEVTDKLVKCPRCSTGNLCFVSSFMFFDWSTLSIFEKDGKTTVVPSPAVTKTHEYESELMCDNRDCDFAVDEEHLEALDAEACGLPEDFNLDFDEIADAVPDGPESVWRKGVPGEIPENNELTLEAAKRKELFNTLTDVGIMTVTVKFDGEIFDTVESLDLDDPDVKEDLVYERIEEACEEHLHEAHSGWNNGSAGTFTFDVPAGRITFDGCIQSVNPAHSETY